MGTQRLKRRDHLSAVPCEAGSPEQQLDMCETGPLKGDAILHESEDPLPDNESFESDIDSEEDEHSSGQQGDQE